MIYVGIDVASQKHDYYMMSDQAKFILVALLQFLIQMKGIKNSTNQSKIFVEQLKILRFV